MKRTTHCGSTRIAILAVAMLVLVCGPRQALALDITANYDAGFASTFEQSTIDTIKLNIEHAIKCWEMAILKDFNVEVKFAWDDIGGTNKAGVLNDVLAVDGTTKYITEASVQFNTNTDWFFDTTPKANSEFGIYKTKEVKLNSGATDKMNVGRYFDTATDTAAQGAWDFFSVAAHEIGHALGLSPHLSADTANFVLWDNEVDTDDDIDIDASFATLFTDNVLPITALPVVSSGHLEGTTDFLWTLMAESNAFDKGERVFLSAADILAVGSLYDLAANEVNLITHIPEPATLGLLALATVLLVGPLRRRQR